MSQYITALTQYDTPDSMLDQGERVVVPRGEKVTKVKDIIKLFEPKKSNNNQMNKSEWLQKTSKLDSKELLVRNK